MGNFPPKNIVLWSINSPYLVSNCMCVLSFDSSPSLLFTTDDGLFSRSFSTYTFLLVGCFEFGSRIIHFLPRVWCTDDPSVWGNCTPSCIHWDLVWAALYFPLSQRMPYCLNIGAFSKRGRLTVWVCSSAHYVGMLLAALVVEASVSFCIHPLGTSPCVCAINEFPFTLFSSSYKFYHWCFFLPDWYE